MHTRASLPAVGAIALAALFGASAGAADITCEEIAVGLWLFQGAGSNVLAMADGEDALVVDGGLEENSADLYAAILEATGARKIGTLIDTHWHPEQVGLNALAGRDGATIIAHEVTSAYLRHPVTSPLFEGRAEPLPEIARPNAVTRGDGALTFAGRRVEYRYLPAAHTDGDLAVFFPDLNVVAAGGAVGSDSWPLLDYWNGGLIGGLVIAHETLVAATDDETVVIPAQGPPVSGAELRDHRDMYAQLFRDFSYLMNHGWGYNDVVDINPLQDHEAEFGDPSRFLDGAFRSKEMAYVPD
jgi:glyoxylase-like metal-dependent hydrolase (beta-lactamase superfamily II)